MEQCRGVDKFNACRQMDMKLPVVANQTGRRQRQHRAQSLAPGFDQMRGDFRDERRVTRRHPVADKGVHRIQIAGQMRRQPLVRCRYGVIQADHGHVTSLDKWGSLSLNCGL